MKINFELLPPMMPNFVRLQPRPGLKQDSEGIDIANFTQEEAQEFADLMKLTFMDHWQKRREKQNEK
jgi:hypothetical protein